MEVFKVNFRLWRIKKDIQLSVTDFIVNNGVVKFLDFCTGETLEYKLADIKNLKIIQLG